MERERPTEVNISIELTQAAAEYISLEQEYNRYTHLLLLDKTTGERVEALATIHFQKMEALKEKWGLLIGGTNAENRAGNRVPYDPKKQIPHAEADVAKLVPGSMVYVMLSEVAKEIDGRVIQVLPPEVSDPGYYGV